MNGVLFSLACLKPPDLKPCQRPVSTPFWAALEEKPFVAWTPHCAPDTSDIMPTLCGWVEPAFACACVFSHPLLTFPARFTPCSQSYSDAFCHRGPYKVKRRGRGRRSERHHCYANLFRTWPANEIFYTFYLRYTCPSRKESPKPIVLDNGLVSSFSSFCQVASSSTLLVGCATCKALVKASQHNKKKYHNMDHPC